MCSISKPNYPFVSDDVVLYLGLNLEEEEAYARRYHSTPYR